MACAIAPPAWRYSPQSAAPHPTLRKIGESDKLFSAHLASRSVCDPQHDRFRLGFVHIVRESADFCSAHTPHTSVEPCCRSHAMDLQQNENPIASLRLLAKGQRCRGMGM